MKLTAWEQFPKPVRKAWMIMRLLSFFILFFSLHLSAWTNAQTVTLSADGISVSQFLNQLEKQTPYSFIVKYGDVSPNQKIDVHVKDVPLESVLDQVLKPLGLSYRIDDKAVYIIKAELKQTAYENNEVPPTDIHGRVTDSLGNPLSGASVFVKGSKKGTVTDAKGDFTLKGVTDDKTLVISFTGYNNKEYKASNSSFNITLSHSNSPLDAVVVIPYGTTTQRLSTGDISTVTAKTIEEQPVSNALAALEGRVPGLVITQTTGAPGGGFTVQIRGQNSITNGNDPFYVIDGVPYPSQTLGLINVTLQNGNPLNYINPADIESIEILKDADATSIYGSRAANGAILITTKSGKAGKMKIDLNVYSGVGKVTREVNLMNTEQYLQMRHEAFYNDSISNPSGYSPPSISNAPDLVFWDTTRYTDWQKVLAGNTAHYNDAQLSVSGGNSNTQYLIGGGFHRETTVFPVVLAGQGADQKVSFHFSLFSTSEDKKFKINLKANYISDLNTVSPNDFNGYAFYLPPDAPPIYNPDGNLNWAPQTPGQVGTWTNPYALLYQKYNALTSNVISNALLSYALLSGLEIKVSLSYTNTQTDEVSTVPTTSQDPNSNPQAYSTFNSSNTHSWVVEPQANYKLTIGKGTLSALAGLTFQENNATQQGIYATGFISDALLENMAAAGSLYTNGNTNSQYKYNAGFGRLNYNWEDKYLLNVSGRRDGSSRFGPGKQFANFGSIGAAWIFSNEVFFKDNMSFLSFGKLRGSYGTSGNDQIGDYKFLDLYNTTSYSYQGIEGLYPQNLFNPNLAWELDKKLEVAIDLGLLSGRIYTSIDYYRNQSSNQLVSTPVPEVTGFSGIESNLPALVQNSGIEIVFNTVNIKSKTFSWTSSFNLTVPKNKLVSFPNIMNSPYYNYYFVGQSITVKKVYHSLGVNDTSGIYQFASNQGIPTYNPTSGVDNSVFVNTSPKSYGGFQNHFQYKNIGFDFFFQFVVQTGKNYLSYVPLPGGEFNQPISLLNRWQKPGDIKPYQQYSQSYSGMAYNGYNNVQYSDLAYSDASFIRLKNISLSYLFPGSTVQKWHIQNLRFYIQAQNILTITKYKGSDPESQGQGLPPLSVWTAGFQVTL